MKHLTVSFTLPEYPKLPRYIIQQAVATLPGAEKTTTKRDLSELPMYRKGLYIGGYPKSTAHSNAVRYARRTKCDVVAGYVVYTDPDTSVTKAEFHSFNYENGAVVDTTDGFLWSPGTYYLGILVPPSALAEFRYLKLFRNEVWRNQQLKVTARIINNTLTVSEDDPDGEDRREADK
jgi:hypothetical protein